LKVSGAFSAVIVHTVADLNEAIEAGLVEKSNPLRN
jgi:hypothetical protein